MQTLQKEVRQPATQFESPKSPVQSALAMSSDAAAPKQKLLILYGSETGNAESISKRLHHDADALGYHSDWAPMKDFKKVRNDVV